MIVTATSHPRIHAAFSMIRADGGGPCEAEYHVPEDYAVLDTPTGGYITLEDYLARVETFLATLSPETIPQEQLDEIADVNRERDALVGDNEHLRRMNPVVVSDPALDGEFVTFCTCEYTVGLKFRDRLATIHGHIVQDANRLLNDFHDDFLD